jgi:restriction system protein
MASSDLFYLLIFCLLISAILLLGARRGRHHWYITQSERKLKRLASIPHFPQRIAYLRKINPYVFEELILSALARSGYLIKRNHRYSGDGGIDGRCSLYGETYLIQAKRYSGHIRQEHVLAFEQLCRRHGSKGLFIHTGTTPPAVVELLGHRVTHVEIISGKRLDKLLLARRPAAF